MEEIEELRAKAIASMASASANQKKSSKNKEEGELSSSDTDPGQEMPTCSSAVATTTTASPVESNAAFATQSNRGFKTGKLASANDPASSVDIRVRPKTSVKQSLTKPFVRKSVPSLPGKPYTSTWYAPSVPNNNLVIRFSDDDSGSDSQEERPHETLSRKKVAYGTEKPSAQLESEYATPVNNRMKRKPRVSLSRTFVSSLTKIHGANSRSSGPSLAEQVTRIQNSDSLSNASAGQENEVIPRKNMNNSKLEDLRQQIALRENQLKLKSAQESKSTGSGLYLDHNVGNQHNGSSKKSKPASGNNTKLLSNEPEKKRLKVEHNQKKSFPDDQIQMLRPATKSELKRRMPPSENVRQKDGTPITQSLKETTVGALDMTGDKQLSKVGNMNSVPSGKITKLTDHSTAMNRSSPIVQMAYSEDNGGACQSKMYSPKTSKTGGQEVPGTFGAMHSLAIDKVAEQNVEQSSECNEVLPSDRIQASPSNMSFRDYSGQRNLLGENQVNIQTLAKMEESHDTELEEAQDHRRSCEQEERNALKAYREAQRALFEANARCTYLYQKRERFSAQFRAFMMDDQSSLWSSMWHKHPNTGMDFLDNVPTEPDVNDLPTLSHQTHAEFEVLNHDLNIQQTDGDMVRTSCQNVVSEPCNERNASTLALLHHKDNDDVNGACTSSPHTNMSADEDEDPSLSGHRTMESILIGEGVENFDRNVGDINTNSEKVSSVDVNDYARLEATLRSELFARLGTKVVSKSTSLRDEEQPTSKNTIECHVGHKSADASMPNKVYAMSAEEHISSIGGTDRSERSISCHQGLGDKYSDYQSHGIDNPEESTSSLVKGCRSTASIFCTPSPVLKPVFSSVRVTPLISLRGIHMKTQEKCKNDILHNEESDIVHSELSLGVLKARLRGNMGEVGCYDCDFSIDPFWPVCTFELRGKCNDEECLLQHVKDYSKKNIDQHNNSESTDREVELSSHVEKFSGPLDISGNLQKRIISAPPTYLVGLDILKADIHSSGSVLAQSVGRCWQKGFSTSSAVPFTIQRSSSPNVPSFNGNDGRLGHQGSRSRQSMYFQSQDDSLIRHDMDEPEELLEKALVLFDGEVNKLKGMKKAQTLLSEALEANPTSVPLWMVYLHIHYRTETTIGKDDMFSHAIRYNEGSYELWLMFINSRVQLDDRLVAYDTAISALCRHASSPDSDRVNASACILDLFLQLVDCLCMSGNVEKAIQRVYGFLPFATDVGNSGWKELSVFIACLTVSDKCLFWVCCVYIVIYKKLPDAVVRQFESKKELQFVLEWHSVQLAVSEKRRALELMKMAVDSVALNGGMYDREVHFLSTVHVQCVAVLEGIECSKNLVETYIKLYPTCLELVLTLARLHKDYFEELRFKGFDDALQNWPRDTPGVQCIWNQYAQCALESAGFDFAKQLMVRWFESVWKVDCPQSGKLDVMEDDGLYPSSASLSPKSDVCSTFSNPKDELFGLLNLSLHRLLQNDHAKARSAIDKALKAATPEDFEHCVREHAVFVSCETLNPIEDEPSSGIMSLLNMYLSDTRVLPASEPLSRKFCQDIRKPRTRQLINNLLGPVSCNYTLINAVLESFWGPSLLPEDYDLKDLVDLVETLMELYPANYSLPLAVCKLITRKSTSSSSASASVLFWACSALVNSIYQAFPVAPEKKWVEAAGILSDLVEGQGMSERFHQHALSIYPFSIQLWKSYYNFSKKTGNESSMIQTAKERGIKLG